MGQLGSGTSAQAWHAARFSRSGPCPSCSAHTGSIEHQLAASNAALRRRRNRSGFASSIRPPSDPSWSATAT